VIPRARALAVAFACALAPVTAHAQTTTFAVDRLVMAGAPGDGVAIWRPDVADQTRVFGQLGLGFSVNPLRVANYVDNLDEVGKVRGNPLTRQIITYFDVGAEILGRLSLQVSFPLIVNQAGNPTLPSSTIASVLPASAALGDLRIEGRVVLFRAASRAFTLALRAVAYAPTGNRFSYGGDNGPGAAFGFATEYDAKLVAVTLDAAYRLRPTVVLNELPVSSELTYGLGIYVPFRKDTIPWVHCTVRSGRGWGRLVGDHMTKMKTMAANVIDRLFIVVYGTANPTDEEWDEYLDLVKRHGVDRTMQLIYTDGGEPSAPQRRVLNELLAGRPVPVAVISPLVRVRGTVTALSWFNRKIRAFPPSAWRDAIAYLDIPGSRADLIEREVAKLRLQVGLPMPASAMNPATPAPRRDRHDTPAPRRDPLDVGRRILAAVRRRLYHERPGGRDETAGPRSRRGRGVR